MKKIVTPLLCWWVALVQRNAWQVVTALGLLTVLSCIYAIEHFSINSDLDKLMKNLDGRQWHANNQEYRKNFPDYQRNMVVVVSGISAEKTFLTTEKLYFALKESQLFDDVFAPVFEDFVMDRILYNIPTEGVRHVSEKVIEDIPRLGKMYHEPSLVNTLGYLQHQYQQAVDVEIFLPEMYQQFSVFNATLEKLLAGNTDAVNLIPKVVPFDTHEMHYQLITVKRTPQFTEKFPNKAMIDDLRRVLDSVPKAEGVEFRVTGEIALMNDEITESLSSVEFAGIFSAVMLLIILGLGVRSKRTLLGIFIMLFMGVMFSIVFTLVMYEQFNTLSLVFVIMLFGLGIDFAVHFSLRLLEVMRAEPSLSEATLLTTKDTGAALGTCALTTALAFLSFLPTEYTGLAELGVISAFGMVMAYVLSLTFMPAWFALLKIQPSHSASTGIKLPDVNIAYPARTILCVSAVLFVLAAWYIKDTRFNYNLLSMRNQESEAVVTLRELQDNKLINTYTIAALVNAEDIPQIKERLLALPSVANVDIPQELLPVFQKAKQPYLAAVYEELKALGEVGETAEVNPVEIRAAIEGFIDLIEQHKDAFVDQDYDLAMALQQSLRKLLLQEEQWPLFQQLVAQGIVNDINQLKKWFSATPYSLDDLPNDIRRRLISADGRHLVQIMPSLDMAVTEQNRQFVEDVLSVVPNAAGVAIHEWGVGQVVVHAFFMAAVLSMLMIFVVLVFTFHRILPAVMIFVPMILVTVFTLAVAKMLGITLNMANILVVPLIFGLGVDTGIHVVHRYHASHDWRETFLSSTGRAVLLSAVTTIGAFIGMAFSEHQGAASIGTLLAIALSLLLLVTFIVLPALLVMFESKKAAE